MELTKTLLNFNSQYVNMFHICGSDTFNTILFCGQQIFDQSIKFTEIYLIVYHCTPLKNATFSD